MRGEEGERRIGQVKWKQGRGRGEGEEPRSRKEEMRGEEEARSVS